MTIEWLEEQLTKALAQNDELIDIISELLSVDEDGCCIECACGNAENWYGYMANQQHIRHLSGALCFANPIYDRARKALEIAEGAQE